MILILLILLVVLASIDPPWSVVILVAACVLEAGEIVLLRRWSKRLDRRTKRSTGEDAMVGQRAEVVEPCRPDGTVRLGAELWKAHCEAGAEAGETVVVHEVRGLTLIVAAPVRAAAGGAA